MRLFRHKEKVEQTSDLSARLHRTKDGLMQRLQRSIAGRRTIDETMLEGIEEALLAADAGTDTTQQIVELLRQRAKHSAATITEDEVREMLREEIVKILQAKTAVDQPTLPKPYTIMVVGVNGAGKTTTIGKLAAQYAARGMKVYIAAADTFRAAAIEQLQTWAQRSGATLVRQERGADPAAVAFDTMRAAAANNADIVLIDTAGRLHNKTNLMRELTKIHTAVSRAQDGAPHQTLLVLDGSTGQNACSQVREFVAAAQVSVIAVTKLDGTAKGGVVIGIAAQMNIPVKYIGVGERAEDLRLFNAQEFVDALLK